MTRTLLEFNKQNCHPAKPDEEVLDIAKRVCSTYVPPTTSRGRGQKKTLHCMYFDVVAHEANDQLKSLKSYQRGWWFEMYANAWLRKGYLPADVEALSFIALVAPEERSLFAAEYQTVLTAAGFELLAEGPSGAPQYIHHDLACLYAEKDEDLERQHAIREEAKLKKLSEEYTKEIETEKAA
jgi:hypothetical protein